MLDQSTHELLARVALMYYEQEMTQGSIADELGISRIKVHRLLREAREREIVNISIDWPFSAITPLKKRCARILGCHRRVSS